MEHKVEAAVAIYRSPLLFLAFFSTLIDWPYNHGRTNWNNDRAHTSLAKWVSVPCFFFASSASRFLFSFSFPFFFSHTSRQAQACQPALVFEHVTTPFIDFELVLRPSCLRSIVTRICPSPPLPFESSYLYRLWLWITRENLPRGN